LQFILRCPLIFIGGSPLLRLKKPRTAVRNEEQETPQPPTVKSDSQLQNINVNLLLNAGFQKQKTIVAYKSMFFQTHLNTHFNTSY
jgi:hypothetical protein